MIRGGFVDSHIHGAFGHDTSDGDVNGILQMAKGLKECGTDYFCPTTMTISARKIREAFAAVSAAQEMTSQDPGYSQILGIHLEGPVLNPQKCGVQDTSNAILPKDAYDLIDSLEEDHPGLLKIISISPELPGALEFIKKYSSRYVISLAHTAADHDTAIKAFEAGASSITHALNAMDPILKRNTGVLGAAIDFGAFIEVIADGRHIDGAMLKLLYSDLLEDKIITVSDSMRGAGMPDGIYDLGGVSVTVKGGRTYYGTKGDLAGSVTCLSEEYKVLEALGIPEERIIKTMTINPLKRLGSL